MSEQTAAPEVAAPEQEEEIIWGPPLKENLRLTTAPIQASDLREYFSNKQIFFVVDYSKGKLKGPQFLTYLTNLAVPADVFIGETPMYEDYESLMKAYFTQISITELAGMHIMAADILLTAKGLPRDRSIYQLPIPTAFVEQFIAEHQELVKAAMKFVDSSQVYALYSIPLLNEHYQPKERYPVIKDHLIISQNLAMLLTVPEFTGAYFNIPGATFDLAFYETQFETYLFKNKRLAHYFGYLGNYVTVMFTHFAMGNFTSEEVECPMFKIGVFDPNHPAYVKEPYDQNAAREAFQKRQPDDVDDAAESDAVPSQPEPGSAQGVQVPL